MKIFDFFEKLYVAELTLRGHLHTMFGLSLVYTVGVCSGFVAQAVGFHYSTAHTAVIWIFSIVAVATLAPLSIAMYHQFRAHNHPKYRLLDDALLYHDYFKELKAHCEKEAEKGGGAQKAKDSFDEWAQEDVIERIVDAASNNRTTNVYRTYHLNHNNLWLAGAAAGTVVCYIIKSLGG